MSATSLATSKFLTNTWINKWPYRKQRGICMYYGCSVSEKLKKETGSEQGRWRQAPRDEPLPHHSHNLCVSHWDWAPRRACSTSRTIKVLFSHWLVRESHPDPTHVTANLGNEGSMYVCVYVCLYVCVFQGRPTYYCHGSEIGYPWPCGRAHETIPSTFFISLTQCPQGGQPARNLTSSP